MGNLFHYSSLKVSLDRSTKSLIIRLNRPEHAQTLNAEMLFELETILSWATNKVEIQTLLFSSTTEIFCQGLDPQEMEKFGPKKLEKFLKRIQRLIYGLFFLPQTVVFDLKGGARGVGLELAIGGDLRLAHHQALLQFDHLSQGLMPCCGGIGLLSLVLNSTLAKNWIMGSRPIPLSALKESGFVLDSYDSYDSYNSYEDNKGEFSEESLKDSLVYSYLKKISDQGPVQRIQTKYAFLQNLLKHMDSVTENDLKVGKIGHLTEDWKEFLKATQEQRSPNFMNPKHFAIAARTLTKNQEDQDNTR